MIRFRLLLLAVFLAANAVAQPFDPAAFQEMRWRMIGPFRGGRTRAIAGVAGSPTILYMAEVNGGVWKSDDAGRTWNPIFDDQPTQSVGAIAVAPSDPNILFVGSGDAIRIAFSWPCSGIRTDRILSAASSGRPTAAKRGSGCCTKTRTPARRTWRSTLQIRTRSTRPCGNRDWDLPRTGMNSPGREEDSSNQPTVGRRGSN